MAATSLKLPDELKRRIERLAGKAQQTPHAFMIDALAHAAERAELQHRFAADAAASERETLESGKGHTLDSAFTYLAARIAGKRVRRPKPRAWRRSS